MKNISSKFKTKKYQNKFDYLIKNLEQGLLEIYQDRTNPKAILSNYRKVFKVTPTGLREYKEKYKEDICLVVHLLVNYTSCNDITIQEALNLTSTELEILKKELLKNEDMDKIKTFFEIHRDGYLINEISVLHLEEDMSEFWDSRK